MILPLRAINIARSGRRSGPLPAPPCFPSTSKAAAYRTICFGSDSSRPPPARLRHVSVSDLFADEISKWINFMSAIRPRPRRRRRRRPRQELDGRRALPPVLMCVCRCRSATCAVVARGRVQCSASAAARPDARVARDGRAGSVRGRRRGMESGRSVCAVSALALLWLAASAPLGNTVKQDG
ncbi:hypothetical protein EVAR_85336_1 [Eumeta japonica]|uniref:Uncharacterized protein n=1 Tax=Eumeta variegata TaxID=151549 RepID=A0A4C1WVF5_EUMVA|nr:hypothetical protein EVAR_85336_1 [Eumeta japonica]